jgi:hypothetical protein
VSFLELKTVFAYFAAVLGSTNIAVFRAWTAFLDPVKLSFCWFGIIKKSSIALVTYIGGRRTCCAIGNLTFDTIMSDVSRNSDFQKVISFIALYALKTDMVIFAFFA